MLLYNIIMIIALWLTCGLWASGRAFAFYQGNWPSLAKRSHSKDMARSYKWGMGGGPLSLLISLCDQRGGYGVKFK
jgi:hypothetical protein